MPRPYRKKSSFLNEGSRQSYLKAKGRERQKEYYWRKKREGRGWHLFPFLLPIWRKWTPERYRRMTRDLGYTLDYLHSSVLSKNTLRLWEESEDFAPNNNILIRMTMFAEDNGWWHIYPFPPKVILVLARTAKQQIAACQYWRLQPEETRWIRTLSQLKNFTPRQVVWVIAAGKERDCPPLIAHPLARRFLRACQEAQGRSVLWKGGSGVKRVVPIKP